MGNRKERGVVRALQRNALVFNPEDWKGVSSLAQDLVVLLLNKDPSRRGSTSAALAHPWLHMAGDSFTNPQQPLRHFSKGKGVVQRSRAAESRASWNSLSRVASE